MRMSGSCSSSVLAPLSSPDCVGNELDIEIEADRRDMPRLHLAQHAPRSPDLKIPHGELKAGTEIRKLADRFETAIGLLRKRSFGRVKQVCVGTLRRTADPTPQLVELRKAQPVGPLDNQCIDLTAGPALTQ